ncbi:MAG: dihydroorotate dehydrogenase [Candidatus Aminicenantes bacterium]|nr:dihydroorotate dehydrogenase [Candidatus Aminicenantes bacterium]
MIDLSIDLGFLKLKNPVLAASGTFGYGLEFAPYIDLNKLGGFVVKGLYFNAREGNPPPRLVETPAGLINAIGLQGIGVKKFTNEILPRLLEFRTALIINVCGDDEEEYARVAEHLDGRKGISALELNISCPNLKQDGRCPAMDPDSTYRVVKRVKNATSTPLITKLSPNVTDITAIAISAHEAGSHALSLVNTFLALAISLEDRKPKLGNVFGGLSGPCIKPLALRMVYQTSSRLDIPLIGIGGISSGRDALEFMVCGAKAVQVGTANFINPDATVAIIAEIEEFCRQEGISRVEDIVGTLKETVKKSRL